MSCELNPGRESVGSLYEGAGRVELDSLLERLGVSVVDYWKWHAIHPTPPRHRTLRDNPTIEACKLISAREASYRVVRGHLVVENMSSTMSSRAIALS